MSGICLGVIRHIEGLEMVPCSGADIDRWGLGGSLSLGGLSTVVDSGGARFWGGSLRTPVGRRVCAFLKDMKVCCSNLAGLLNKKGRVAFVVGDRHVGGYRLSLGDAVVRFFSEAGLVLEDRQERRIQKKMTPSIVHRQGRSRTLSGDDRVFTMHSESVVVMVRK